MSDKIVFDGQKIYKWICREVVGYIKCFSLFVAVFLAIAAYSLFLNFRWPEETREITMNECLSLTTYVVLAFMMLRIVFVDNSKTEEPK